MDMHGLLVAMVFVPLTAIVVASIIVTLFSLRSGKYRRLSRAFFNVDPMFNYFRRIVPGPREAMENLNREIKENRRNAAHASHRSRPL